MNQLVNVLIAVLLAAALSGFSILPAAEAGPVAGDSTLEFSTGIEKQGDQEGATESPETEPKYSFKRVAALLASLFYAPPENTGQDGAEASTETTPGNEVTADESDNVGEVSQSVPEGSPENLTVPETSAPSLEQAEIEQKYVTKLQSVISDYERESLTICDSAGHDLGLTLLGVESVAEKYRSAAQALEANCDGYYYLTLANFRSELQSGGYPDDAVRSMQERYESTKQQYAARLDEATGK